MAPRIFDRNLGPNPTSTGNTTAADLAAEYERAQQNPMPTVRDELERIAQSDTDVGTLAKILLSSVDDNVDDVGADDEVPTHEPRTGERKYADDGNLYEWGEKGWVLVNDDPATGGVEYSDKPITDDTDVARDDPLRRVDAPDGDVEIVDSPTGDTPPFGGAPDAPNTAVDDTSQEGRDI